jgi:hypothetical protein
VAYSTEVLADSPYFYCRMGGAASPLQDETATNADVTITGATLQVTGALTGDSDKAVSFDGVDDKGSVALDLSDTSVITVEFWLLWDTFANDDDLALEFTANWNSNNGSFLVNPNQSADGTFAVGVRNGGVTNRRSYTRPSEDAWHHYVLVLDHGQAAADTVKVYIDGAFVSSFGWPAQANTTGNFANSTLNLMCRNGASLFGAGDLDELAVYKTALSEARIEAHYDAGTGAGGTPHTHSQPDTATVTDASGRAFTKAVADTISASDTDAIAYIRVFADAATVTDSVTPVSGGGVAHTFNVDDTFAATDMAARVWAAVRAQADAVTVTDDLVLPGGERWTVRPEGRWQRTPETRWPVRAESRW